MHSIRTYFIRLFINSDQPDDLKGTLQQVNDPEPRLFASGEDLLAAFQADLKSLVDWQQDEGICLVEKAKTS